jgi:hypothetical protein
LSSHLARKTMIRRICRRIQKNIPWIATPPLLAGKILLRGKPLRLRRGTRLPQPGGGQAGVPACRSTPREAGRAGCPWNLMGRMPMPRLRTTVPFSPSSPRLCAALAGLAPLSPVPLCAFAPLRYLRLPFFPPVRPYTPESEGLPWIACPTYGRDRL